jgi:shikimate dehydrogenase
MQNAGIAALGLNWRYLAFDVLPSALKPAIEGAMRMGFVGLNLTLPHKFSGVRCVDVLDPGAERWGAINTIHFEGRNAAGDWRPVAEFDLPPENLRAVGFNTDADAVVRAIREDLGLEIRGASVLLLGAGGAASVAALRIAQETPDRLFIVNRTIEKAFELVRQIQQLHPKLAVEAGYPKEKIDLVINGTSLGLKEGDPLPFGEADKNDRAPFNLAKAAAAFDMVYRPEPTRFLKEASAAGCKTADGLSMLLYQGAAALELWTGQPAPLEAMKNALWRKVRKKEPHG